MTLSTQRMFVELMFDSSSKVEIKTTFEKIEEISEFGKYRRNAAGIKQ